MKLKLLFSTLLFLNVFFWSPAYAADPAVNVGAIEVLAHPDTEHLGVYPYVSGSLTLAPVDGILVIPGAGVEYSPEFNRWGFAGTLVLEYTLTDKLGLDLVTAVIHDQEAAEFSDAAWFLGTGPGVTYAFDRFLVSPSIGFYKGINVPGWSLVPGLNIALPL